MSTAFARLRGRGRVLLLLAPLSAASAGADIPDAVAPPPDWYSGDTHAHVQLCTQLPLLPFQALVDYMVATDLNVAAQLYWGGPYSSDLPLFLGLVNDPFDGVTGTEHLSTLLFPDRIIENGIEVSHFTAAALGHVSAINIEPSQVDFFNVPQDPTCPHAHDGSGDLPAQVIEHFAANPRALVIYAHQVWPVELAFAKVGNFQPGWDWEAAQKSSPTIGAGSNGFIGQKIAFPDPFINPTVMPPFAPIDAALGRIDAVETIDLKNGFPQLTGGMDTRSHGMFYKLLSAGVELVLVGGTDTSCHPLLPASEQPRTYALLDPGESLTFENWTRSVKDGRVSLAAGPYQFLDLDVDGNQVGSTVVLSPSQTSVVVTATLHLGDGFSLAGRVLEIVQDGVVACTQPIPFLTGGSYSFQCTLDLARSGWIAARTGPGDGTLETHSGIVRAIVDEQPVAGLEEAEYWMLYADYLNWLLDEAASAPGGVEALVACSEDAARADLKSARDLFSALRDYAHGMPPNVDRLGYSTASCKGFIGSGVKNHDVDDVVPVGAPLTFTNFHAPPDATGHVIIGTHCSEATPTHIGGAAVFVGGPGGPLQSLTAVHPVYSNEAGYAELEIVLDPSLFLVGGEYYVQWIWSNPPLCPTGNVYSASEVLQLRGMPIPGVKAYGTPSPWSSGTPTLDVNDVPKVGNAELGLLMAGAPPGAPGWVLVSSASDRVGTPWPLGVTTFVDLGPPLHVAQLAFDAAGEAFHPLPLSSTATVGSRAFVQAVCVNPPGEALLSATNALELVVQP